MCGKIKPAYEIQLLKNYTNLMKINYFRQFFSSFRDIRFISKIPEVVSNISLYLKKTISNFKIKNF